MRTQLAWLLAPFLALGLAGPVFGQSAMQKVFDSLSGRKPAPPPAPVRESASRLMEILVELAWLGDPQTFPFYLEARVEGPNLHVRGNVPSQAIREHAMKLAQLNTPLPVADGFNMNPRLVVHPARLTPEQLQNAVRAALRESLPGLAKNLQTRSTADGQVAVLGNVDSFERKLTISQTLRRLHGCTVVINLTKVAYDPDGKLARAIIHPPAQTAAKATPAQPRAPAAQTVSQTTPAIVVQVPGAVDVAKNAGAGKPPPPDDINNRMSSTNEPPVAAPIVVSNGPRLTPAQIQKRIKDGCPRVRDVRVTAESNGDIKVDIHVLEESDCDLVLNQIFAIPDLASYPLRPYFNVAATGKN